MPTSHELLTELFDTCCESWFYASCSGCEWGDGLTGFSTQEQAQEAFDAEHADVLMGEE